MEWFGEFVNGLTVVSSSCTDVLWKNCNITVIGETFFC